MGLASPPPRAKPVEPPLHKKETTPPNHGRQKGRYPHPSAIRPNRRLYPFFFSPTKRKEIASKVCALRTRSNGNGTREPSCRKAGTLRPFLKTKYRLACRRNLFRSEHCGSHSGTPLGREERCAEGAGRGLSELKERVFCGLSASSADQRRESQRRVSDGRRSERRKWWSLHVRASQTGITFEKGSRNPPQSQRTSLPLRRIIFGYSCLG